TANEGLLSTPSGLQQAGEEAAVAHPWDLQLDRPHARVPGSLAVAIAVAAPLRRAFVTLGADVFSQLHLHQFLGQDAYSLTQKISLLHTCLAQHLGECHSQFVGHRAGLLSSDLDNRAENHPM